MEPTTASSRRRRTTRPGTCSRPTTPEQQDLELLGLAFASRYHWGLAGGPKEQAIADWMASRCLAAIGEGSLAVRFADSALALAPDATRSG